MTFDFFGYIGLTQMKEGFREIAKYLESFGITAETLEDHKGKIVALRLHGYEREFVVVPYRLDDGSVRLAIEPLEVLEGETKDEKIQRILKIIENYEKGLAD